MIITKRCFAKPQPRFPSWKRNVPKPMAAGALWRSIAKNISIPSPDAYVVLSLTIKKYIKGYIRLQNSEAPNANPSAIEWITKPIVETIIFSFSPW